MQYPPRLPRIAAALTSTTALLAGLAGCGGGSTPEPAPRESLLAAAREGPPTRRALAATAGEGVTRLVVRARAMPAGGVGAAMTVRIGGQVVGSVEVRSTEFADHVFDAPGLAPGVAVDIAFTNDAVIGGVDRNLVIGWIGDGRRTVLPHAAGVVYDKGEGAAAFDGVNTVPGQATMFVNGALRLAWPQAATVDAAAWQKKIDAARWLAQTTFGASADDIDRLAATSPHQWLAVQLGLPPSAGYVDAVQSRFARGDDWRPGGRFYTNAWVGQRFWANAATAPDQLRQRMAFALQHVFVVSQAMPDLWNHSRAYARYVDVLNQHAFGNYRQLLHDVALSPVMGAYLSHLRNRKEDPATGRLPDENFAREVMQLFTIGLVELNRDGTPKLDAAGRPIETYGNADVMALAKVFTGFAWALPDNELTDNNFRYGGPKYSVASDRGIDLLPMKPYPGQSSTATVTLFAGKPHAVVIPGSAAPLERVRLALDALFRHPNVGPFVARQLIQQFVSSHPSPGYVERIAAVFDDNGSGVRGDLREVLRALLLDPEARNAAAGGTLKLREPVLRIAQWMRAFGAASAGGDWAVEAVGDTVSQRALHAPSVFGWFRPGYVPPGGAFAAAGRTAPELQIVNEATNAGWVNLAEAMAGSGIGWNGKSADVAAAYAREAALIAAGDADGLLRRLDLLLFGGRMSAALKTDVLDAIAGVEGRDASSHVNRARIAVFVALSSPEFMLQN